MADKRYNFKVSPEYPSSEQIAAHKDFDALLSTYESTPVESSGRIRSLYWIASAVAAALVGFVMYQSLVESSDAAEEYFAAQAYVNPPLDIPAQFASQSILAGEGGVFEYENGSRLIVPEAAFVTGQGAPVDGKVDIRYREFHDYVDFFASGIPMEYDSAGQRYLLESVGMVEIYAEQSGERLNLAPGKSIKVELISEVVVPADQKGKIPRFNVYQLDNTQRNWVYKDIDQIDLIDEGEALPDEKTQIEEDYKNALLRIDEAADAALAQIEATEPKPLAPVKPVQPNNDDFVFDLEFNDSQLEDESTRQQLKRLREQYGHMLWQVNKNNPGFDQQLASSVDWDDMKLRKLSGEDYELKLISEDRTMTIKVRPVVTGNDYQRALEKYNQQMAEYQDKLNARAGKLSNQKKAVEKQRKMDREEARATYKSRLIGIPGNGSSGKVRHRIRNRFVATSFGIWNCDRPINPFSVALSGEFQDDQSHQYEANTAYLVNKDKNTICRFYTGKGGKVQMEQKGQHMLWVVTPEQKIAIMRPEELKRMNQDKDDYTFDMKVIDKKIETEADLRRVLTF